MGCQGLFVATCNNIFLDLYESKFNDGMLSEMMSKSSIHITFEAIEQWLTKWEKRRKDRQTKWIKSSSIIQRKVKEQQKGQRKYFRFPSERRRERENGIEKVMSSHFQWLCRYAGWTTMRTFTISISTGQKFIYLSYKFVYLSEIDRLHHATSQNHLMSSTGSPRQGYFLASSQQNFWLVCHWTFRLFHEMTRVTKGRGKFNERSSFLLMLIKCFLKISHLYLKFLSWSWVLLVENNSKWQHKVFKGFRY